MSDNEDATAPLRHSEELRVQYDPFDESFRAKRHSGVFPATDWNVDFAPSQLSNHRSKVHSSVRREKTGDILEDGPSLSDGVCEFCDAEEKSRASWSSIIILEPLSFARNAEVLAREASNQHVYVYCADRLTARCVRCHW